MRSGIVQLSDRAATDALARCLAPLLRQGDVITLQGDLGAGKTTFARSLLHALGVAGDIPSPTFMLLQTYTAGDETIYHFDLYRLESGAELDELGWDDALADGITVIEWPERAAGYLPPDYLALSFDSAPDGVRSCTVTPYGLWGARLKDAP